MVLTNNCICRAGASATSIILVSFPFVYGEFGPAHSLLFLELAFTGGVAILGVLSIGAGFVTNKISLIVLRALSGIGERDFLAFSDGA